MLGVGDDPGLGTRVAGGPAATGVEGDTEQRHRDPLAGREQHVHLTRVRDVGDLQRHGGEVVGGVAHRGHHHDDVVAALSGADDAVGDRLDPLHGPHGRATELHHDDGHAPAAPWVSEVPSLPTAIGRVR